MLPILSSTGLCCLLALPAQGPSSEGAPAQSASSSGAAQIAAATALKPGPEQEQAFFGYVDLDGGGWISFAEAQTALELDRGEFQVYDRDRDGRIDREEFGLRYREIVDRVGAFRPPRAPSASGLPPRRSPAQLLKTYDKNLDQRLDPAEVERCLSDYKIEAAARLPLYNKLDGDRSAFLSEDEIPGLAKAIDLVLAPGLQPTPVEKASSIEQLFGSVSERTRELGAPPEPPQVAGPVPVFLRLDLDRDGRISEADLARLRQYAPLPLRSRTLLAGIDRDGDGALSRDEFERALAGR